MDSPRRSPARTVALYAGALVLAMALLAGCGNSRTPVPNMSLAAAPDGFQTLRFPVSGVSFQAPRNWKLYGWGPPVVTVLASGDAVVSMWRYPGIQGLPSDPAALLRAQTRLIDSARAHDPSLQLIRSKLIAVDGAKAIELDALERIAGQQRRVRSTHVFAYGAELVLEEYAPPSMFHTVDHAVFSPIKRTLKVFPAAA